MVGGGGESAGAINKEVTNQDFHLERWFQGQVKDRQRQKGDSSLHWATEKVVDQKADGNFLEQQKEPLQNQPSVMQEKWLLPTPTTGL